MIYCILDIIEIEVLHYAFSIIQLRFQLYIISLEKERMVNSFV